jgi:hypothetical protein
MSVVRVKLYDFTYDCLPKEPETYEVPNLSETSLEEWLDFVHDYIFAGKSAKYREYADLTILQWQGKVVHPFWEIEFPTESGEYMSDILRDYASKHVFSQKDLKNALHNFTKNKEQIAEVISRNMQKRSYVSV